MISPALKSKNEVSEAKKDVVVAMKNELDIILSSFNVYNVSDNLRKNYSELMASESVGTIIIPETYHRIRTALVKRECTTDGLIKNIK